MRRNRRVPGFTGGNGPWLRSPAGLAQPPVSGSVTRGAPHVSSPPGPDVRFLGIPANGGGCERGPLGFPIPSNRLTGCPMTPGDPCGDLPETTVA